MLGARGNDHFSLINVNLEIVGKTNHLNQSLTIDLAIRQSSASIVATISTPLSCPPKRAAISTLVSVSDTKRVCMCICIGFWNPMEAI